MPRMGWLILAAAVGLGAAALLGARLAGAADVPDYRVELADGQFELRRYPDMVAAEVVRGGPRQAAVRSGFGPLARYIFARDRSGEKIAMTAPVTQSPAGGTGWEIRFIMPAGAEIDRLPAPSGDVRLVTWPAHRAAAVRFSGRWTDARFAEAEARLRAWLAGRGLAPGGEAIYAYYNDPFTPFFLRRNEVIVPLAE